VSDFPDGANACPSIKDRLRADILAQRRKLTSDQLTLAGSRVRATVRQLIDLVRPAQVAGYLPIGSEPGGPGLAGLLAEAVGGPDRVLLPVLLPDRDLDWARFDGPDPTGTSGQDGTSGQAGAPGRTGTSDRTGTVGLRQPAGPRLGRAAVADVELVVVPALAVDHRGVRLGRGGGSYDRALARVPSGVPVVALLHDGELLPQVPAEPHDRPVSAVITPSEVRWFTPAR